MKFYQWGFCCSHLVRRQLQNALKTLFGQKTCNGSCVQPVNKQISQAACVPCGDYSSSWQYDTSQLSGRNHNSYQSTDENFGVLNTVDKLPAVVCSSLLFSPVTHTVIQNLGDCFTNISFFFKSIKTPESWSEPPPLSNKAKAERDSGALPISVLCQFSASSAKLLRMQSSFYTIYIFWEKDASTPLLFHFFFWSDKFCSILQKGGG